MFQRSGGVFLCLIQNALNFFPIFFSSCVDKGADPGQMGEMAFISVQTPCLMLAFSSRLKQLPELARRHADDVKELAVVGAHHGEASLLGAGGNAP